MGYLSSGALLREQVKTGTALGKLAQPILARGEYLPDDLMCRLLKDWLEKQRGGWVLDGFPRSVPQAVFLDECLAARDCKLDAAISLEVPFEQLLARIRNRVECPECRWSGQKDQARADSCPQCSSSILPRADDTLENFISRYQEFLRLTQPVISYYQERKLMVPCDATASQDEVSHSLMSHFTH